MAPRLRSPTLESRTARLKLKVRGKPYYIPVSSGVSLGYRRNAGPGSWLVRCADGKGGAWTKGFAVADDREDASGDTVLDFFSGSARNAASKLRNRMRTVNFVRTRRIPRNGCPAGIGPQGLHETVNFVSTPPNSPHSGGDVTVCSLTVGCPCAGFPHP